MNAGGHIAVAARIDGGARAGALLGAALPDLATMGGFRLLGSTGEADVAAGIGLHHRTDDAFHGHEWFRTRNKAVTEELLTAGLARGPARACGHVGVELLLDGELLADPAIASANDAAFDVIADVAPSIEALVVASDRTRWRTHLDRLAQLRLPTDYDDPNAVAARLHRILAHRPRLALPIDQVDTVAQTLATHQASITSTAHRLVTDLAKRLGSGPSIQP